MQVMGITNNRALPAEHAHRPVNECVGGVRRERSRSSCAISAALVTDAREAGLDVASRKRDERVRPADLRHRGDLGRMISEI